MAILRVAWAAHYLRWVAILSTTTGVHVAAFLVPMSGGGAGNGPAVPEGHVMLYVPHAEMPNEVLLTPVRATEQLAEVRPVPVEVPRPRTPPHRILPAPPARNPAAQPPSAAACPLPQAHREEASAATANIEPLRRTVGAGSREVNQPMSLGDSSMPPRISPGPAGSGAGSGTPSGTYASGNGSGGLGGGGGQGRGSGRGLGGGGGQGGGSGRGLGGGDGQGEGGGEGVEPDFALAGKPVYPVECRRGECTGGSPCEGISRWRVTVQSPNAKPSRIERLQSAGCEHLDASTENFLREARIPRAGVFLLRFRFKLDGH